MADAERTSGPREGGWRLAGARSAYLQSAKEQPIDWHPWGPEPFEIAKRTGRPILLDVGAVWCHWCHVMDEGTYSDAEVARLLRQHFVAVKVDRDEHPEVDRRYQRQVNALTGEGGWPLTAFLNADGEVFLGGTYFPPQDGMGRPGFRRVLKEVARLYREEPAKIRENAAHVQSALDRRHAHEGHGANRQVVLDSIRSQLHQSYDPVNAGFGFSPKFPHPTAVSLLLLDSYATGDPLGEDRARETLLRMADGGMYDQVGGGFHRYAVDEGWHIPHFEKMGVDNAALLYAYTEGARRFGDARLVETIRGTLDWSMDVLADAAGGFGSSQDADNAPGDDGGYFTWSRPELKSALDSDEFRLVSRIYGVGTDGRMPHDPDRNVLYRLMSPAEAAEGLQLPGSPESIAERARTKLARVRAQRPSPVIDRAQYADINGGFLRATTAAARYLGDPVSLAFARRTADRFVREAYHPERGIAHRLDPQGATGFGHLEDQVQMALGLMELSASTLDRTYFDAAGRLLALVDREFRGESGLFRDLAPALYDGPNVGTLGSASYPVEDNPHLAANSAAALAFVRYSTLSGDPRWADLAARLVDVLLPRLDGAGLFGAGAAWAARLLEVPGARIVVTGSGPEAEALARSAERTYHPNSLVFRGAPPPPFGLPEELSSAAGDAQKVRALICFGTRCLAPVTDPAALPELIRTGGRAAP